MQVNRTEKYQQMRKLLNEKQWRPYLALEAKERGNLGKVAHEAGVSKNTIRRGVREGEAGELYPPGARLRKAGGGRKKVVETDATLLVDLEGLLRTCKEFEQKGNPTISVDGKKKELIGHFKNQGREWQAKGEETCVNV